VLALKRTERFTDNIAFEIVAVIDPGLLVAKLKSGTESERNAAFNALAWHPQGWPRVLDGMTAAMRCDVARAMAQVDLVTLGLRMEILHRLLLDEDQRVRETAKAAIAEMYQVPAPRDEVVTAKRR